PSTTASRPSASTHPTGRRQPDSAGTGPPTSPSSAPPSRTTPMSDRILKVALVGAGFHSRTTLLTTLVHLPVRLQAVVDRDLARAEGVAAQFGCRAYADTASCYAAEADLDAVLLCAGPSAHPA